MSGDPYERGLSPAGEQVDYMLTYPAAQITAEDIPAIVEDATRRSVWLLEDIVDAEVLTYDTVMGRLHGIHDIIGLADGHASFMAYVHPDEAVREAATNAENNLKIFSTDLVFSDDLYRVVRAYSETDEAQALTDEEARFLKRTMQDFRHAGHELDPEAKQKLLDLRHELDQHETDFSENIRNDTTQVALSEDELAGTSDTYRNGLARDQESGAYLVTMKRPDLLPLMQQASNRETRAKVTKVRDSMVTDANRPTLAATIRKRHEAAVLLGYPSWAHYRLEDLMAKTPDIVEAFYDDLIEPLTTRGLEEIAVMTEMLHADGYEGPLQKYDMDYYDTRLKERDFGINPEKIAEYFPLDATMEGLFQITGSVFGIRYRQLDVPTWHADVQAFAIDDAATGEELAMFYTDLYPREGKFNHFAEFTLAPGREMPDGSYRNPRSALVGNFPKPTAEQPSLLKPTDVTTLFHEFGHVLHDSLGHARFAEFSGTNTERDFVEAPSQIMEHWTLEPDILQSFARHHETGEPIPTEMVESLVASKRLNTALFTLRQIMFGKFDMSIHGEAAADRDLDQIVAETSAIALFPQIEGTFYPASFAHMLDGYDASYNGYLRSKAIGDDMFSRFDQEGLTNPVVGQDYRRKILSRGGTVDAEVMVLDFLGRPPNNQAFLRNLGIEAAA